MPKPMNSKGKSKSAHERPLQRLVRRMSEPTGNPAVDSFLAEFDRRISAEDSRHDRASKERLRHMRPLLRMIAINDTENFSRHLHDIITKHFPEVLSPNEKAQRREPESTTNP